MALPNTDISLGQIKNEFGVGSNTVTTGDALSEYYKDGDPIPSTTANANIPASGAITIGNFRGASVKPSTPVLSATVASFSQIDLSWTNVTNEVGYQVERSSDNVTFGNTVDKGVDVLSHSYTSLTSNTTYWFRVRAYTNNGLDAVVYSDWSTVISAKTSINAPGTPTLSLGTVAKTSISMSWNAVTGANNYEVWGNNSSYSTLLQNSSTTSYTNSGLTTSTTYYYRVRANSPNDGYSAWSNAISATTLPPDPVLSNVQWNPGTITAGSSSQISWTVTPSGTSVSFSVSGGSPSTGTVSGTSVTFNTTGTKIATVTATNASATVYSYPSLTVNAVPPPPPTAPTIGTITWSSTSIQAGGSSRLSWSVSGTYTSTYFYVNSEGTPFTGSSGTTITFPNAGSFSATVYADWSGGTVTKSSPTITVSSIPPPPPAAASIVEIYISSTDPYADSGDPIGTRVSSGYQFNEQFDSNGPPTYYTQGIANTELWFVFVGKNVSSSIPLRFSLDTTVLSTAVRAANGTDLLNPGSDLSALINGDWSDSIGWGSTNSVVSRQWTSDPTKQSRWFRFTTKKDYTTEGVESLRFKAAIDYNTRPNGLAAGITATTSGNYIMIQDTSTTPAVPTLSSMSATPNPVNEGSQVAVTITGSSITNSTVYIRVTSGSTLDFTYLDGTPVPSTIVMTSNSYTFNLICKADATTEPNESITFEASLNSSYSPAVSTTVNITETSSTTIIDVQPYEPAFGFVVLGASTGTLFVYFSSDIQTNNLSLWSISSSRGGDSASLFTLAVSGNINYATITPKAGHSWRMDTTYYLTFNAGCFRIPSTGITVGALNTVFYNSL